MTHTSPELLTTWPETEGLSDQAIFGVFRSRVAMGDVLGAQMLACELDHPELQDAAFNSLPHELWNPTHHRVGWELYIYETRAALAWHEFEGHRFPSKRTCLLPFEAAYAWAKNVAVWDSVAMGALAKRLTPAQAASAGLVKPLPGPPLQADCAYHGLRNGDFVGFDGQIYQFVGVSLAGVVWLTNDPDKFVTQTRALRALKSRQLDARDAQIDAQASQNLESANDDTHAPNQLDLFAS